MLTIVIASVFVAAASGAPAILARNRSGEILSAVLALAASASGFVAAIAALLRGTARESAAAWHIPNGALAVRLDPLAAAFLLPIFLLGAITSLYGLAYWPIREHSSAPRVRLFTGLLVAGMAGVVIAAHAVLFLLAWEMMAIAAFFLIATEDRDAEVRGAAWWYLIATHIGTIALFAMFVTMRAARGSFLLGPLTAGTSGIICSTILLLALAGFGFKAGIVPLHFWLPGAHANAPSHVSALLSGAMLKVGIYGIVRILMFLPSAPAWWGGILVALGLGSALIAISLALGQSDMKRTLAYSSIENIGIIVVAIGVFVIGRARGADAIAALALAAAIAHVWNHSLFKGLLFLGSGSILHATGTRRIERMGGLLESMPLTGGTFLAGAAAAAALPGTSAFLSEALLYVALLREGIRGGVATLAAAALALTGALAVACFVRLAGAIFLGVARSDAATHAHESSRFMTMPLVILATACVVLGIFPGAIFKALGTVVPFREPIAQFLGVAGFPLQIVAIAIALTTIALVASTRRSSRRPTWDCGYAQPTARMQYTAGSFSEWFTARLLPSFLRPVARASAITSIHPEGASFATAVNEPFADRIFEPLAQRWAARAMRLRWVQQGRLPLYLLYIFVALLAGMTWVVVFPLIGGKP